VRPNVATAAQASVEVDDSDSQAGVGDSDG
jgi:hypothetical protein